jgi:hypothetical protein
MNFFSQALNTGVPQAYRLTQGNEVLTAILEKNHGVRGVYANTQTGQGTITINDRGCFYDILVVPRKKRHGKTSRVLASCTAATQADL